MGIEFASFIYFLSSTMPKTKITSKEMLNALCLHILLG